MAELLDLGNQCALSECQQLDFLPVRCHFCSELFCKEHSYPEEHECSDFNKHQQPKHKARPGTTSSFKCSLETCEKSELTKVTCPGCQNHFCLGHRHMRDHDCPNESRAKEYMPRTNALVDNILSRKDAAKSGQVDKPFRNLKQQKLAAKVQLMKLKQSAKGRKDIPESERIYFRVVLPKRCNSNDSKATFVSKHWVMGKVLDSLAEVCRVENPNNSASGELLKLFRRQDGCHVCEGEKMQEKLEKLLQSEELFNGDRLVLEYISRGCESPFLDVKGYKT